MHRTIVAFAPLAAIGFAILPMLVQPTLLWVFVGVLSLTIIALAMFRTPVIALMPDITPTSRCQVSHYERAGL